jgi:hypothetical protein
LNKIKSILKISVKVSLKSNSSKHYYVRAASKLDIQKIIDFYTNPSLAQLRGEKLLSFKL